MIYQYQDNLILITNNLEWGPKQIAHPIVLDEAHNIFDIFIDKSKDLVELLAYVYEIREWRLVHIVNTQYPNQLAKSFPKTFKRKGILARSIKNKNRNFCRPL